METRLPITERCLPLLPRRPSHRSSRSRSQPGQSINAKTSSWQIGSPLLHCHHRLVHPQARLLQNFPGLASFVWSARRRPRPRAATSSAGAFCVAVAALIGLAARLLGAHKGQEAGRQVACFRYTNNVTCCGCFLRTVLASSSNASCMACSCPIVFTCSRITRRWIGGSTITGRIQTIVTLRFHQFLHAYASN